LFGAVVKRHNALKLFELKHQQQQYDTRHRCSFYSYIKNNHYTLLEEKVLYRILKGSISATYLEPLKGSIHSLKKGFLWVLYKTLGLHTWPIEPFTKKKWFYIESFWCSIYEAGDGTISGSK